MTAIGADTLMPMSDQTGSAASRRHIQRAAPVFPTYRIHPAGEETGGRLSAQNDPAKCRNGILGDGKRFLSAKVLRHAACVMDAVEGMQGNGPSGGDWRRTAAVSTLDPFALDYMNLVGAGSGPTVRSIVAKLGLIRYRQRCGVLCAMTDSGSIIREEAVRAQAPVEPSRFPARPDQRIGSLMKGPR